MFDAFLSIDEGKPLGVCVPDRGAIRVIPLDDFLEDSKIDMSNETAARYAERLQLFVDELKAFSNSTSPTG